MIAVGAAALGTALAGTAWAFEDAEPPEAEALAARYGALTATGAPDISPDGQHLARRVAYEGRYVLRIEAADGSAPVLWAPAEDAELDAFHWTGDGNLLVVTTRLAATAKRSLDPDGKRSKRYIAIFEERRPQVVTPKGQTVASLTFRRLGQIDVF